MRQDISLATLGPVKTLGVLDRTPPPLGFDFENSLDLSAQQAPLHPRVATQRNEYWQPMGFTP